MATFAAIDVETADVRHVHVCAIGVARVEGNRIVATQGWLVRPPCPIAWFNQQTHRIRDVDVAHEPTFREVWRDVVQWLRDVEFLVAHNAGFDRSAIEKSCAVAGVQAPRAPYRDTLRIARDELGIRPADLPSVCARLGIPLARHHHAQTDAEAAARVMLAALDQRARSK